MAKAYEPDSAERHRSVPIQDTITRIPGYPRKLVIFKIPASSYWWVRYYAESHIFKRTTKTEIKRDALEAAKRFYDDITIRIRGGSFDGIPAEVNAAAVVTFAKTTKMLMESELAKLNRNQLSKISYDNMHLRYDKHILPFFGQMDVLSINYKTLDEFLQKILAGYGDSQYANAAKNILDWYEIQRWKVKSASNSKSTHEDDESEDAAVS